MGEGRKMGRGISQDGVPPSKALSGNGVCSSWGGPACNVVGG